MTREQESVVIVGAARTPVGKYLGGLRTLPVQDIGTIALEEAIRRSGVDKEKIEEVIVGHVTNSQSSQNVGRVIGLDAGLNHKSTGFTVNRLCGSGIQSAISAMLELQRGNKKVIAAGGVEALSRAPYYLPETIRFEPLRGGHKQLIDAELLGHGCGSGKDNSDITHMGVTAENVVRKFDISRETQDQYAYNSHQRAIEATNSGRFAQEIIPVEIIDRKGNVTVVDTDEHIRFDTSLEKLAKLRPAFAKDGSVTAGNASGMNDGGAFEILTTESYAKEKNLEVMAHLVDYAITGVDPAYMGLGPVSAIQEVIERNDLKLEEIDVLEINEAFAGQILGCMEMLGFDMDSDFYKNNFNIHGGGVSLGHPLGMSGARIITSIVYEFKNNQDKKYGIASACIGGGQGIALLLKNGYYQGE